MSRGLHSDVQAELAKDKITFVDLIELHFDTADGGTKFLNNGQFSFNASTDTSGGSQTFNANGEFISFEMIKETESAKVNEINIVLSGASNTFTSLFLNNDYVERRVVIYRQFFDTANATTPIRSSTRNQYKSTPISNPARARSNTRWLWHRQSNT